MSKLTFQRRFLQYPDFSRASKNSPITRSNLVPTTHGSDFEEVIKLKVLIKVELSDIFFEAVVHILLFVEGFPGVNSQMGKSVDELVMVEVVGVKIFALIALFINQKDLHQYVVANLE